MAVAGTGNLQRVHPVPNTGFAQAYLIEGDQGLMAVDVGSIGCAQDIADYIHHNLSRPVDDLRYITATHFHIDHIGGIGHLLSLSAPRTRVLFHAMVEDYLTGKKKISMIRNWFVGIPSATMVSTRYLRRFSHLAVGSLAGIPLPGLRGMFRLPFSTDRISYFGDEREKDSSLGDFGFGEWDAVRTPGHTEDSICFYNGRTAELISGDLIVNISPDGTGEVNRFCWDREHIRESYEYLCGTINPVRIYPGHGEVITGGARTLSLVRDVVHERKARSLSN